MVEPANNILQSLDPVPRLPRTRKLVRFVGKTYHDRRDFAELKRAKHFFTAGAGRRAIICFPENEHHRRLHVFDVSERRSRFELLLVVKWRRLEPRRLKKSKVSRVPPRTPTRDVALRNGRRKPASLSHNPVRQQSAAASAGHTKFFVIDIAAADHVIYAGHQIFVIVTRIVVLDHVAEILPIGRAPARIWIKHT